MQRPPILPLCLPLALLQACGGEAAQNAMCSAVASVSEHELQHAYEAEDSGRRVVLTVPEPSSAAGERDHGDEAHAQALGGGPSTIYLNREGGTFSSGSSDSRANSSSIVSEGCASVPPFSSDEKMWRDVVQCVRDQFAAFDVTVTDREPEGGAYVEAVIGGLPSDMGLPRGVAGIAPMDASSCGVLDKAIVYVFSENLPESAQVVCEVAAQEIAHAYGLDHQYLCEDPMSYLHGCGAKAFQNVDALCGEDEIRPCMCGRDSQNSAQLLAQVLGTRDGAPLPPGRRDEAPPSVTVLSPEDGETVGDGHVVEIVADARDDVSVSRVTLSWDDTGEQIPCPSRGESATCARVGTTYAWRVRAEEGARAFSVEAEDHLGKKTRSALVHVEVEAGAGIGGALAMTDDD